MKCLHIARGGACRRLPFGGLVLLGFQLGLAGCSGTGGTAAVGGSAEVKTPHSLSAADSLWARPPTGCPPGSVEGGDTCAACPFHVPGACEGACERGVGPACALAGFSAELGLHGPADDVLATREYDRACVLGSGEGCEALARMRMWGRGCPRDERRALEAFISLCQLGRTPSCLEAGISLLAGRGAEVDQRRGESLVRIACARGSKDACAVARSPMLLSEPDRARRVAREEVDRAEYLRTDGGAPPPQ